ncbi:uncharacterized protein LAESUDRAFT_759711 [Laetiporus sulphureus 93-53]|uniref:Uncharacterized protein n=1 Tax=Laetiporus sulphureus 93-53 TaxID=1314785 RepID=A0A165E3H0_9APHY|nr:uncharacterized protein LAESUDRAFT_759711 [Laetiporus sulphureus 93-53]KZT06176.1 hypothetical protein LAESUDRAFT_759711 [Laetiporus sulphureus 93-53]
MSDHPDEFFLYHKMTDLAKSPKSSSNEAAGWDIYAAETHEIPPHSRAVLYAADWLHEELMWVQESSIQITLGNSRSY